MKKIAALHEFLCDLNIVSSSEIDSYVDALEVVPAGRGKNAGIPSYAKQIVLSTCKYTATFYISGFPFLKHPVELLVGQMSAWLLEHDDKRLESGQFSVNVDVIDEHGNIGNVANLEIAMQFDEDIIVIQDDGGNILFNNRFYSLA